MVASATPCRYLALTRSPLVCASCVGAAVPSAAAAPAPTARPLDQRLLEAARHVPAVLDRPRAALRRAHAPNQRPAHRPGRRVRQRVRPSPSTAQRSASACVRPHQQRSLPSPPTTGKGGDRRADRPQSRRKPRSYQVTLDGLGKAAATQRWKVSPRATFGNRVSRRQPELSNCEPDSTELKMTLSSGMTQKA